MKITKHSDSEIKIEIPQPNLVETKTKESLKIELIGINESIINFNNRLLILAEKKEKIEKILGITEKLLPNINAEDKTSTSVKSNTKKILIAIAGAVLSGIILLKYKGII